MSINGIEVTKEDFEGLLKSIRYIQQCLKEKEVEKAEWTLGAIEMHLSHNLLADGIKKDKVA